MSQKNEVKSPVVSEAARNDSEKTVASSVKSEKAIRLEAKSKKLAAYLLLKSLVDPYPEKKYMQALKLVRPSLYGITQGAAPSQRRFIDLLLEKNEMNEDDIFAVLKVGRKECAGFIRKHLRKSEPSERVWVSFNPNSGKYKVEGKGADAPKDWAGFIPINLDGKENELL